MKGIKTAFIITFTVIFVCITFIVVFGDPVSLINKYSFGKAVKTVSGNTVTLNEITPFQWDSVYTFAPYVTKDIIQETIGFKSHNITEALNEGMVQLIFVKGNNIVCNIIGYPSSLGYNIFFIESGNNYSQITYTSNTPFNVEQKNNIVYLSPR